MNPPRISVVMPCFNHERYVVEAATSVLEQSLGDLELIIIDDASGDSSWDCIQRLDDPRLRCLRHQENCGAHATLNEALALAEGDYLAVINSDDIFSTDRLQRCVEALQRGADLVGTDIELMDKDGQAVAQHWWIEAFERLKTIRADSDDWLSVLLDGNLFMTTSNFVMTRDCWQQTGAFRDLRFVHDYDFLLRALRQGMKLDWIDEPLLRYRLHESNTISESPLKANFEAATILREHAPALIGNADQDTRRIEHLCSQWRRTETYIDEIHNALRHHKLVAQEQDWQRLVSDRERWIAERDATIVERNSWVADRDEWIRERDQLISELGGQVADRDAHIEAMEISIGERDQRIRALETEAHDLRHSRSYRLGHALLAPGRKLAALASRVAGSGNNPRRVRSLGALRREVERATPPIRCASFDIFDTLLGRCVEPPELIHRRVAEALCLRLEGRFTVDQILAARREAETTLRQAALAQGTDHECHYDPLVRAWLERLCGEADATLVSFVQELELELECLALFVKPGVPELIAWLRDRGIRVIAVSDMYLGHDHLDHLFERLGIAALIDRIYVSAEFGFGKYSGKLHARVLELEGLPAHEMIHVGDNLHSDAVAPARIGVRSCFLDDRRERNRRRDQALSAEMVSRGGIWPGRQFFEIVSTRIANTPADHSNDFFFRYGRDVLGPAFCTFTLGLTERLKTFGADKVFFLARDGHVFQRIYELWRSQGFATDLPAATYAYASRRVVSSAAVAEGIGEEQARVAFYNPKHQGLLSVLKTYGLPPEAFTDLAVEHGFADIAEHIEDWEDARLKRFLADPRVQNLVREHGQAARSLLHDYFAQIGFMSAAKVALVDIGWNGTIQKFMQHSFGNEQHYPDVRGYYFALVTGMHGDFEGSDKLEGLIMDARRGSPFERAPFDFEELFEQGARALEATTIGYARGEGKVSPVLKPDVAPDRKGELVCNPAIDAIHRGVLCHATHFLAAQRLTAMDFETIKPYALAQIERAVAYPTPEEVAHIRTLVHTEDFGHDHVLDLAGAPLGWGDLLRPGRARGKLHLSPWPYAQVAHLATGIPAWLLRLMKLRAVHKQQRVAS